MSPGVLLAAKADCWYLCRWDARKGELGGYLDAPSQEATAGDDTDDWKEERY